jgi:hypothetical protein
MVADKPQSAASNRLTDDTRRLHELPQGAAGSLRGTCSMGISISPTAERSERQLHNSAHYSRGLSEEAARARRPRFHIDSG